MTAEVASVIGGCKDGEKDRATVAYGVGADVQVASGVDGEKEIGEVGQEEVQENMESELEATTKI